MKNFLSKLLYLEQMSLTDMHQQTRNWLSLIAFWKQDFAFMLHLVEEQFDHFLTNDKSNTLQPVLVQIYNLKERVLETEIDKIEGHEAALAIIIKNPLVTDETNYRHEHELLATEMTELENTYRALKTNFFKHAKAVLKDIKSKS